MNFLRTFQRARVFWLGLAIIPAAFSAEKQPNILLITADDLGCQLSCYGETRFATPQLDALAAEGIRFANFYVAQASCSASRSSLLTGLWPHQNGQYGLAHLGFRMPSGLPNLPALLQKAGYRTGIIGKLHVEPAAEFPWDWMPAKEKMAAIPTRNVRWVAQQSREFFADAKAAKRPFFYYVNYFDPHGPYAASANQAEGLPEKPLQATGIREAYPLWMTDEAARKRTTATIGNTILRLDAGVGLLLRELNAAGLAESTLVVFLGDNGLPVLRGKTTSYEAGVHVPLLVRWPGTAKGGQVRQELVSEVDLMPTLLRAVGAEVPPSLPGHALQPLLRNEPVQWPGYLFTEMNFHMPSNFIPQRTVRDSHHKLLLNLVPGPEQAPVELFDLTSDPRETKNLADIPECAAVRKTLESTLAAWRKETGDPLLDPARLERWQAATDRWQKLPRIQVGTTEVVTIAPEELERLR